MIDLRCSLSVEVNADNRGTVETTRHEVTFSVDHARHDRERSNGTMYILGQQLARLVAPVEDGFTGTYDDLIDGVIDWFQANRPA